MDETPSSAGSLLPPATTRWQPVRAGATAREPRIAPPFVVRTGVETVAEPPREPELPALTEALSESAAVTATAEVLEEVDAGESDETRAEGVVRPAFETDTDAALEAFTLYAADLGRKDDFPLEAFIVPEQAQRVPSGMEGKPIPAPPETTPVTSLADRLEKLSHRLRIEDIDSLIRRLASGDRLDTMLAGLLAGYLAGNSEHS